MNKLVVMAISAFVLFGASAALAGPPPGIAGDVTVVNGDANPVPVKLVNTVDVNIVDQGNETPLQERGFAGFINGFGTPTVVFGPVPEGKRWIVEYVSLGIGINTGSMYRCKTQVREDSDQINPIKVTHHLIVTESPVQNGINMVASTPIKLIAESGQTVQVQCTIKVR